MTRKALPHLPSDLIDLSLNDLAKIERSVNYEVGMEIWHQAGVAPGVPCKVCLAGAVMAQTLGGDKDQMLSPASFTDRTADKLSALNMFRQGRVAEGFTRMNRSLDKGARFDRHIPEYEDNRRGFKLTLRKLARDLRAEGM